MICQYEGCDRKTIWSEVGLADNAPDPGKYCRRHFYQLLAEEWGWVDDEERK